MKDRSLWGTSETSWHLNAKLCAIADGLTTEQSSQSTCFHHMKMAYNLSWLRYFQSTLFY